MERSEIESAVMAAMRQAGIEPPAALALDGKLHRFSTNSRGGDDAGWYVVFTDHIPAARFGDFRRGIDKKWALPSRRYSDEERRALERRLESIEELRIARAEIAQREISEIWNLLQPADRNHPYCESKKITPLRAKQTNDGRLAVPMYDANGAIVGIQYIAPNGEKRFHPGTQARGAFLPIGEKHGETIYLAEGYATAITIHEVTSSPTIACFSASNLSNVVQTLRQKMDRHEKIIIVADNDLSGTGETEANKAAQHGASVIVIPASGMDANDYHRAGFDLRALLTEREKWLIPLDEYCGEAKPIRWLIKKWLPQRALVMIHGPAAGGKTFLALDWAMSIAAGREWCASGTTRCPVVYLAGEGHYGLRLRAMAWLQHHKIDPKTMQFWISRSGVHLDTPQGFQHTLDSISDLPVRPRLIIVDTLHRFLAGDENSARDTRIMLDACSHLMEACSATVILVHHTGVANEVQHRARGSSAWRAALDVEISVVPGEKHADAPTSLTVVMRKSKDFDIQRPLGLVLYPIALNINNEDNEPCTSCVCVEPDARPNGKDRERRIQNRRHFEAAWRTYGKRNVYRTVPILTADAAIEYFVHELEIAENSARQYVKPSSRKGFLYELMRSGDVEYCSDGWLFVSEPTRSVLMLEAPTWKQPDDDL